MGPLPSTPALPAVDRAAAFLLERVQQVAASGRTRLPTIGALAAQGRFSPRTLSAAVSLLRRQGVLTAVQRGGIRLLRSDQPPPDTATAIAATAAPAPPVRLRGWRGLGQRISTDLVAGMYPPGAPLPSYKELCARYGTSYETLRRALDALAAAGRLTPHKRGFRVHQPAAPASHAALVLVAHSESVGDLGTVIPRNPEFLRVLERECLRAGVNLDIRKEHELLRTAPARTARAALGYLLWIRGIRQDRLALLIDALAAHGRPVAVLDEDGVTPLAELTRARPQFRVFSVANSRAAGVAVGALLLGAGHRRVAFLSPVGATLYSRHRLEGLKQAYDQAGLSDGVAAFVDGRVASFEDIQGAGRKSAMLRAFGAAVERLERQMDPGEGRDVDYFYRFYTETYLLRRAMQAQMLPLMTAAAADHATAWVGVNDWAALVAMDWLRRRSANTGRRTALLGFDDTFEAFSHGLTSYNFNMPALVQAMLGHVLEPPAGRGQAPPVEIPGVIVARQSTARRV
jgi:DNA-binding GntR family transcriptional regulator